MKKNKNIKKYENISDEQKQKRRDYQKQYKENMTDKQKQKRRDYQQEYYAEKKLTIKIYNYSSNLKNNFSL